MTDTMSDPSAMLPSDVVHERLSAALVVDLGNGEKYHVAATPQTVAWLRFLNVSRFQYSETSKMKRKMYDSPILYDAVRMDTVPPQIRTHAICAASIASDTQ